MDEAALAGLGVVIAEEIAAAAGGVAVVALQDGQGVAAVLVEQAGDAGGVVVGVGLELPGAQGLGEDLALQQPVPDGVRLVAVGDHSVVPHNADGVVDDEGGVHHLALIIGTGADAVPGGLKDTVAAVLAAAHNEIGDDGLLVVGGAAQDDAPARVGVVL